MPNENEQQTLDLQWETPPPPTDSIGVMRDLIRDQLSDLLSDGPTSVDVLPNEDDPTQLVAIIKIPINVPLDSPTLTRDLENEFFGR